MDPGGGREVAGLKVGVVCQPITGEAESGDTYCVLDRGRHVIAAVIDGLGHGQDARLAARRACEAVARHADLAPEDIVRRAHEALHGTRGAVMAVVRIERGRGEIIHAGVGNIDVRVVGKEQVRRPAPVNGIVGHSVRKFRAEAFAFAPGDLLIMTSDGISERFEVRPASRGDDVQGLANRIALAHGKHTDDQMVLVLRDEGPPA